MKAISPKHRIHLWYVLLAVWGVVFLHDVLQQMRRVQHIPYSQFLAYLDQGRVEEIRITTDNIQGRLKPPRAVELDSLKAAKSPLGEAKPVLEFRTVRVDAGLADRLALHNVKFSGVVESTWMRDLLSWIVPALLFFAVWAFLVRRLAARQGGLTGGFMSIGKSKAKIYVERELGVTFADVAGVDEAKDELREVVEYLKDPKRYARLGARLPKGILLVGPPGTGKTLLARATAGEAGVTFFSISGSEFVEMFVGVGAARVRDLFAQAQASAPCVVFIDELDALGRARGLGPMSGGGNDEKEQTLNQLLVEMDGFDPTTGVMILAATNRPEILDPALLRAGRFDRQVLVDRPDKQGRVQILLVHLKKVQVLAPDVIVEQVAALTPGFTGADLANLVNEATLLATRRGADQVAMDDFNHAVERIVAGLEKKNRLMNPHERAVVAHHEMGHALVSKALPGTDTVHKVSIIPRGVGALGYTIQRPIEDRFLMTSGELENKMAVLLGGRAAEQLIFQEISTGAADDLMRATDIARSMVTRYGMDATLGLATWEAEPSTFLQMPGFGNGRRHSEETAREIDVAVRGILDRALTRASDILTRNRRALERGAQDLLGRETLSGDELPALDEPAGTAG